MNRLESVLFLLIVLILIVLIYVLVFPNYAFVQTGQMNNASCYTFSDLLQIEILIDPNKDIQYRVTGCYQLHSIEGVVINYEVCEERTQVKTWDRYIDLDSAIQAIEANLTYNRYAIFTTTKPNGFIEYLIYPKLKLPLDNTGMMTNWPNIPLQPNMFNFNPVYSGGIYPMPNNNWAYYPIQTNLLNGSSIWPSIISLIPYNNWIYSPFQQNLLTGNPMLLSAMSATSNNNWAYSVLNTNLLNGNPILPNSFNTILSNSNTLYRAQDFSRIAHYTHFTVPNGFLMNPSY
jgi:hypothetical protein